MDRVELPIGFSAEEFLHMLDRGGDGRLTRSEFIQSFYRLLDSNDFQQRCVLQTVLNEIKVLVLKGNLSRGEILKSQRELAQAQAAWTCEVGARLARIEDAIMSFTAG